MWNALTQPNSQTKLEMSPTSPVAAIIRVSRACGSHDDLRYHRNGKPTMIQTIFRDSRLIAQGGTTKCAHLYLNTTYQGDLDLDNPEGFDRIIVVFAEFHQKVLRHRNRNVKTNMITYVSLPVEEPESRMDDWCDKMLALIRLRDGGWGERKPDFLTLNPLKETDSQLGVAVFEWTPSKSIVFRYWRHWII